MEDGALPARRDRFCRRVLVGYTGSDRSRRALDAAAAHAEGGGSLVVLNVVVVQSISSRLQTVSDEERERQAAVLDEARRVARRAHVPVTLVRGASDDVAAELLRVAREEEVDLIVVGGSPDPRHVHVHVPPGQRLVREAPVDVLVVR